MADDMQAGQARLEAMESLIKKYQTSIQHVEGLKKGLGPEPNPATLRQYDRIIEVDEANMKGLEEKAGKLRTQLYGLRN